MHHHAGAMHHHCHCPPAHHCHTPCPPEQPQPPAAFARQALWRWNPAPAFRPALYPPLLPGSCSSSSSSSSSGADASGTTVSVEVPSAAAAAPLLEPKPDDGAAASWPVIIFWVVFWAIAAWIFYSHWF